RRFGRHGAAGKREQASQRQDEPRGSRHLPSADLGGLPGRLAARRQPGAGGVPCQSPGPRVCPGAPPRGCCSSVVEHPLGKGEVDSSILSGSTIYINTLWLQTPPAPLSPHQIPI